MEPIANDAAMTLPVKQYTKREQRVLSIMPDGCVNKNAALGRYTGLSDDGLLVGATGLCSECVKDLRSGCVPSAALVAGTWQGLIPPELELQDIDHPNGLTLVEASMLPIYSCITHVMQLPSGGDWGMKKPTFAVVNNLAHVAKELPRRLSYEDFMFLQREGSPTKMTFRPKKVNDAIRWLVTHNVEYAELADIVDYYSEATEAMDVPNVISMTEEESTVVEKTFVDTTTCTTTNTEENEMALLFTEEPLVSHEENVRTNLVAPKKARLT